MEFMKIHLTEINSWSFYSHSSHMHLSSVLSLSTYTHRLAIFCLLLYVSYPHTLGVPACTFLIWEYSGRWIFRFVTLSTWYQASLPPTLPILVTQEWNPNLLLCQQQQQHQHLQSARKESSPMWKMFCTSISFTHSKIVSFSLRSITVVEGFFVAADNIQLVGVGR